MDSVHTGTQALSLSHIHTHTSVWNDNSFEGFLFFFVVFFVAVDIFIKL